MSAAPDSLLPPHDAGLPVAGVLLDAAAMTPHLRELFSTALTDVRVRYLDYVPGATLTVQYDATMGGGDASRVEAFATADGDGWRLHAYPDDPMLPLLGAPADELMDALALPASDTTVTRLAWIPSRRAVLRCGEVIVKLYADSAELARAERAIGAIGTVIPTAALIVSRPNRGAVVQQMLGGRPLDREDATPHAREAAAVLRQLHAAELDGLDDLGPATLMATTRRPASLAAFGVPSLAERIAAVSGRLDDMAPAAVGAVPVHGDFNVGQILVDGDTTWVVDFDTLATGSPSVDLAAYAANVHNGRAGDDDNMQRTLRALADAYGRVPTDLTWHLAATMLRRVDRPIRRLKKRWPERTEAVIGAVEALLR
jgi:aminoglycoside phosphotransferase (APT) family kinase protein